MQHSNYQLAIFDWIKNGSGNAIVEGVAGCGKTTTIVESINFIDPTEQVLLLAFNRHIRLALQEKINKPNVQIHTFNSFGWSICRRSIPGVRLCDGKNVPDKDLGFLRAIVDPGAEFARFQRMRSPILRMVGLLKALNQNNSDNYLEIADAYGVDLDNIKTTDLFGFVLASVYEKSINQIDTMTYDDQLFQPIYRDMMIPKFDIVMVDEAQDCSPINIELIKRIGGRSVLIGDPGQAIYMFRGAHPDALGNLSADLEATTLPLSVCYRCPDAVIESAKTEVPRIEAPVPNLKGQGLVDRVSTKQFEEDVQLGDLVVCRNTHPLIKRCLRQWALGRPAFVKGRDLSNQLIELIEKVHGDKRQLERQYNSLDQSQLNRYNWNVRHEPAEAKIPVPYGPEDMALFLNSLSSYIQTEQAKLIQRNMEEIADQLNDRWMGITSLAEDCSHVVQLIVKIQVMFDDADGEDGAVNFMTGHKCKGLEYERVWILRPDLCPSKRATTPAAKQQEKNLMYVMKTRAMAELRFVNPEPEEIR